MWLSGRPEVSGQARGTGRASRAQNMPASLPCRSGAACVHGGPVTAWCLAEQLPPAPFKESLCLVVTTCPAMLFLTFTIEGD